jgi:lipoate-protein ligase B
MREGWWLDLGQVEYGAAHARQLRLVEARQRDEVPDLLVLCEHPPVITVGRRLRAQANILLPRFPIHEVERGGDATYHGPGQLVGYPILKLEGAERDLHRYLRDLEEGLILLCGRLGVPAGRREGWTGVWTADQERKVASIGIAVRRWVTYHGFALNVTTDLSHFQAINPCGLEARVMTSVAREGGRYGEMKAVRKEAIAALGEALRRRFVAAPKNVPALG